MSTLTKKDDIQARIPARRGRGRPSVRRAALGDDYREVDTGYLESLLNDLGEPVAAHEGLDIDLPDGEEEEEHARDRHAEDEAEHARAALRQETHRGGGHNDLADAWTVKSGKTPLLTAAQEVLLAKRVERGDRLAREELMNANVRLVASVARRYLGRGLALEDLMQEGLIGLMRAIDKYNYRKGYRFSTYATHWIRQAVSRAVANQGRSIRLPAHVVDSIGRVARVREELFQRLGRPPTRSEVASEAGITEAKLAHLLRSAVQPVSLETPVGEEGESRLGDFVPAGPESSPSERVFVHLVRDEIERALGSLTPREREVVALRYGLGDDEPHTLEETGRRLHITRERARQIEAKALEKLRHAHTSGRLSEALS